MDSLPDVWCAFCRRKVRLIKGFTIFRCSACYGEIMPAEVEAAIQQQKQVAPPADSPLADPDTMQ